MTYLVYNTYAQAYISNAIISNNMRLSGNCTQQWAEPQQRLDGKYVIPKPTQEYMEFVEGIEEEYNDNWFTTPTEG